MSISRQSSVLVYRGTGGRAFTLLELLVAIAVMALVLLVVTQITSNTRTVTSSSRRHIDSDAEARMVFDRLARDFSRMVKRSDVDYLFTKQPGSDTFFFYSEAPGFSSAAGTDQNGVSLVGYRVNPSFQLERLGKGLTWDGTSTDNMVFLTFADPSTSPPSAPAAASRLASAFATAVSPTSTDTDYHIIAQNVFRLEICFLLKSRVLENGTILPALYSNSPFDTRAGHSSLTGIGLSDVQSIVVTLAILDDTSKKILPTGTALTDAATALPDPTDTELSSASPALPGQTWRSIVESGNFSQLTGIPAPAASHVRIYQRVFDLNTPSS